MLEKIKWYWDYIQSLLDVRGDVVMLAMSGVFIIRVFAVLLGYPPITSSEAMMYGSAIGSFAYSNRGPK